MENSKVNQLTQNVRQRIVELKRLCEGVDESTASRAPAGRWSPKEILSHLWGPERSGHLPIFQAFLEGETPTIHIHPENSFFSDKRARMALSELLSEVEREYNSLSNFAESLSEAQLARKAHIPELKGSPLGEYPTLESLVSGLVEFHLQFHIDHMREILQSLGIATK